MIGYVVLGLFFVGCIIAIGKKKNDDKYITSEGYDVDCYTPYGVDC